MDLKLNIKFYKSASGKQNMWIEKNHDSGIRYEIDSIEDVCKILKNIMKEVCD